MTVRELLDRLQGKQISPETANEIRDSIAAIYREGYEDAVRNYAIWRNGEQFVGALNRPLKGVLAEDLQKPIPVRY